MLQQIGLHHICHKQSHEFKSKHLACNIPTLEDIKNQKAIQMRRDHQKVMPDKIPKIVDIGWKWVAHVTGVNFGGSLVSTSYGGFKWWVILQLVVSQQTKVHEIIFDQMLGASLGRVNTPTKVMFVILLYRVEQDVIK
jgi:hypothetical protein